MTARMKPSAMPRAASGSTEIDRFRAQHLELAQRRIEGPDGAARVTVDETESPLAWLARRKAVTAVH